MQTVVIDALTGRQVVAGDEEVEATQPLVHYLVQKLGWSPRQLMTRPQWRVPRAPSAPRPQGFPVDVAIFDTPENLGDENHVRILVECKAPSADEGLRQIKTYLGLEPEARLGIWFNGERHVLVYKLPDGSYVVDANGRMPKPSDPLSPTAARKPICFGDLVPPPRLGEIFRRLRDQIAAQDTKVNRDEFILNDLANLLICKIADEQAGEIDLARPMAFQRAALRGTGQAIRDLFEQTKKRLRAVFTDPDERLQLDDASIENVVTTLQPYRLLGHDRHAVGHAFQVLRPRVLKGEEGAYFTPAPLVDCVVSILDPDHETKVIDPACGTGGFLAAALDHVYDRTALRSAPEDAKSRAMQQWARELLFAVDKDAVSVKLCKAYLTLLGDGRSHVYRANSIDRHDWFDDIRRSVTADSFDMVMTNPPFGKRLKVSPEVGRHEGLLTCRKWKRKGKGFEPTDKFTEQQLGITFFERCLCLLRDGGRMAIVLPETFLFSKSHRWFVDWVLRTVTVTHVIDVPMVAFEEFCRAKTCILFVAKRPPTDGNQVMMSYPRSIGQDKKGNLLRKVNDSGLRTGALDNEMAEAVPLIVGAAYDESRPTPKKSKREESRLRFVVAQKDAAARRVLVPRYYWRQDADTALAAWTAEHPSQVVTLGELHDAGVIRASGGHGSPPGNARATGDVPYVKVTDLKNWRINENPTNFINQELADALRAKGPSLEYGDLVSPARASANIGQFCVVMPWQTHVVLTKEVLVLRAMENDQGIDSFLLLALMSLRVVQDQYAHLALMNTNREDLDDRWREVRIPLPATQEGRRAIGEPVRAYFEDIVKARRSYEALLRVVDPSAFGTRP